ncbi:MAG TPA: carboxypeptidase [Candidatus Pelethenecus sp.]|nr:carboxypeptidase [Candidatus Pelethenecus sp.]
MSKFTRLTGVNEAKVIQVIEIKSLADNSINNEPTFEVTEYYSLDGQLLARHNPTKPDLELGEWTDKDEN